MSLTLKARLALELTKINSVLARTIQDLPEAVQVVAKHSLESGGKRLRPFLTIIAASICGYTQADIYDLAITLEMLHTATLMHDDILDNANLRRGKATAHKIFGSPSTILAGDALLAKANDLVANFNDPRLCRCFSDATLQTANGEILEINAQYKINLDFNAYEKIIRGKTAWLIRSACLLGALKATQEQNLIDALADYGENIGLAFQLVDDALDFTPSEITGKPMGGDLIEGKFTPPVQYYRQNLNETERKQFDLAFQNAQIDQAMASEIAEIIVKQGYAEQTREKANQFLDKAKNLLSIFPDSSDKNLLIDITEYIRKRQH